MMKVGDIGVLQNCYNVVNNNRIAEIIGELKTRRAINTITGEISEEPLYQVICYCPEQYFYPEPRQIRPITDPDAEQETEQETVLINENL